MSFKNDFVWGAATAAFQIEGAAYSDGKGLNIWDVFCKEDGKVFRGHTGDTACNHYNKIEEDVKLMKEMGLKAYRFSVSWARILPNGVGEINQKGIDFYNKLINALIENGIEPYMTLYHWDLPYELSKKGGWMNRDIVNAFAEYTKIIADNFSDRVKNYITLNEPEIFVGNGYMHGSHAPGYKLSNFELLNIGHNALLAHGIAVKILRENSKTELNIGISVASNPAIPVTEREEDVKAAQKVYDRADIYNFVYTDSYWLDPIVFGKYNDGILETCKDIMPKIENGDMELISQKIDFIGRNIYMGDYYKADENGEPVKLPHKVGFTKTAFDWPVSDDSLYYGVKQCYKRYKMPIYITENGMSCHDTISLDGKVHDPNRQDYLNRYLLGLKKASSEGFDIRGYFVWSLMDNFEWSAGYNERFGIIYVDYETYERIPKDSAYWYKSVIENNGSNL